MQTPDNFYVVLPSNSSSDYFPANTHANYTVKLPKAIIVLANYEVALVETFFQSNWYTVTSKDTVIDIIKLPESSFTSIKIA